MVTEKTLLRSKSNRLFQSVFLAVLISSIVFTSGCSITNSLSSNRVPEGAEEFVKSALNPQSLLGKRFPLCPYDNLNELRDVIIKETRSLPLTAADEANGVSKKWNFYVTFIYKCKGDDKWQDGGTELSVSKMNDGKMKADTDSLPVVFRPRS